MTGLVHRERKEHRHNQKDDLRDLVFHASGLYLMVGCGVKRISKGKGVVAYEINPFFGLKGGQESTGYDRP
jgi:hypothetical protein